MRKIEHYSLNKANFCPKYIVIASNALNMSNEKKNGGRWNNKINKSVTKKLVKIGWSIKLVIIFLNITNSNF
jgi:hypothetical protein